MINQCYEYEAAHTIQDVLSCNGDLNIALVADSHLDNSVPATIENISAVDQAVHFDCCVHLGDFLAGEIGRRYAKLLLRQQPVARDLRTISAAMRMISDMERIGDQAADIAEIARDVQAGKLADETPMGDMARTAISMVTDSVDAFVRQDLDLAHQVIARDDKVDSLFLNMREQLVAMIGRGEDAAACLDMLMIAKYYERIGDHACNIAQWVEYALTGQYEDD